MSGADSSATTSCPHCGESLAPGARFCASCGAELPTQPGRPPGPPTDPVRPEASQTAVRQAVLLDAVRQATLGEYEILTELGRGGMATVYLGHDIALDRKVAVKVMSPALLSGEGMVERFKREARTAASLSHPNIIPIYAVRESDQILYFVMKFVEGRPLDSIIKEVGPLPIPMIQAILNQVGAALGYAHRRGIIHRDVKPANIMLDTEGWAVVTDFGIAKVTEVQGLTMTGATVGTPTYMSPEQCAADKELTGASDQYSLGIVAYEMLAGKLPFQAESMMAIMYAHFNEPPPPIAAVRPDCPPDLEAAVMRMLEKEPEKRWPSLEDTLPHLGGASLAPDDPIRTRMVILASAGPNAQLLKRISTPTSPAPFGRSQTSKPTTRISLASLTVSPAEVTIGVGVAVQLTGKPRAAGGSTLPDRPTTWASTNREVATVSPSGLVTAVAPGSATITATCGSVSATASVVVTSAQAPRRRWLAGLAGALAVAGIAMAVWRLGRWEPGKTATPPLGSVAAETTLSAPRPGAPTADTVASVPPAAPARRAPARTQRTEPAPRLPAAATPRRGDDSLLLSVRATARAARDRAASAGATATDLAGGDSAFQAAESLGEQDRVSDAMARFSSATALWTLAERTAHTRESAAAAPPAATPVAPQPADARREIAGVIAAYARAIESRDVDQVRRAYPGLTSRQARVWTEFFRSVKTVRVTLQVDRVDLRTDTAEASVSGTLEFASGRSPESRPITFRATLERSPAGWRLSTIQ